MYLLFLNLASLVFGYGYKMHLHLGNLTDMYLQKNEPELYKKVVDFLQGKSISYASIWADKVKKQKNYTWSKNLHFIDILECSDQKYNTTIINKYCNNNCVVSGLQDFTNSLKYNFEYDYVVNNLTLSKTELLKFIIHFIQDFSQPMHLLGYNRGGNDFKVNVYIDGKNKTSNLHYIWDSMLPEYFINNYVYNLPKQLIESPKNYYDLVLEMLNLNIKVSCDIYPRYNYIIFDDYFNPKHFVTLFDNYHRLMVSTLKFIFE